MSPEGGEAEQVRDLTTALPAQLPTFGQLGIFLDGISTISPDGSKLATLMSQYSEMGISGINVYLIDLADANAAPQQIATAEAMQAAVPTWQGTPAIPAGLSWKSDGKGVVVFVNSSGVNTPFTVLDYIDLASGTLTPVVNFESVDSYETYMGPVPGTEIPWRAYSPWTASLAPSGEQLLMLNNLGGAIWVMTSLLPPDGQLPPGSVVTEDATYTSTSTYSSRSKDGKVLMYGLLLTIKE